MPTDRRRASAIGAPAGNENGALVLWNGCAEVLDCGIGAAEGGLTAC